MKKTPCHAPGTGLGGACFVTGERGGDRNGSKRADGAALLSRSRSPIEQGVRIGVAIETQVRDRADQQTTTGEARATSSQR